MSERLISILTAFYNAQDFIETAHQSLLSQTYKNWEWICVDDCSTDNTLETLNGWAKEDSRIKVIKREKNGGNAACSFNTGIPHCSGTHIQILGHDDELTPDTLEEIAKRIDETGADIVIPDLEIVNSMIDSSMENFKIIGVAPEKNNNDYKTGDRSIILSPDEACKLSFGWRIHGFAAFSKKLLEKVGYEEKGMNGDEYSCREFFLNANKIVFSKGKYVYLRRPTSITAKLSMRYFDRFLTEEKLHELVRKNHFEKKYKKIMNNSTLNIYFDYVMKYLTKYGTFSENEKKQVEEFLAYGIKLIQKYCSPFEIFKINVKILKYKLFYKLWKYFDIKLRKKNLI